MIATSIRLGESVELRGIVLAPLFPRRTPEAAYVTRTSSSTTARSYSVRSRTGSSTSPCSSARARRR